MKHSQTSKRKTHPYGMQVIALGTLCVASSFAVGIRTAGDVQTVAPTSAGELQMTGDMNNDGRLGTEDAIIILEIAQGYTEATPEQLQKDPNGDGQITVDDAVRLLHDIESF
jgi:hypothetical protein